jgi:hypothetical protein
MAGRRPILLALIIMATVTIGLLLSGWLTPAPGRAQPGQPDPDPGLEKCTNCVNGSVVLSAPTNAPAGCVGSPISIVAGISVNPAQVTIILTNKDGSTTNLASYQLDPTYNVTWTMSGVGANTNNGTGTTATFTPTNSGCGTVAFTAYYTNQTPCGGAGSSAASGSFSVGQLYTNCTAGMVAMGVSSTNFNFCIGSGVTLSVTNNNVTNAVWVATNWPSCCTNVSASGPTNYVTPVVVSNWWTLNYGNYSTNGPGLSASLTPTNCGSGTVTFSETYKNNTPCDPTNVYSAQTVSLSFNVDAVTSLTPSAGLWVDDGDDDPDTATYLVQSGCSSSITVTAGDGDGLTPSTLPSCWTPSVTGKATQIDKMHFSVPTDGSHLGTSTITIECGSSYKKITIIVYWAEIDIFADQGCCCPSDVGHSWWSLSSSPSDIKEYIPSRFAGVPPNGVEGAAGYFDHCNPVGPGQVIFGAQPECGGGSHDFTGDFEWCISFGQYIHALTYVYDLNADPGTYVLTSNNCTTQAEQVAQAAGVPLGYSGIYPCGLNEYLNSLPHVPFSGPENICGQ